MGMQVYGHVERQKAEHRLILTGKEKGKNT
jgi:hypothetical protein